MSVPPLPVDPGDSRALDAPPPLVPPPPAAALAKVFGFLPILFFFLLMNLF